MFFSDVVLSQCSVAFLPPVFPLFPFFSHLIHFRLVLVLTNMPRALPYYTTDPHGVIVVTLRYH